MGERAQPRITAVSWNVRPLGKQGLQTIVDSFVGRLFWDASMVQELSMPGPTERFRDLFEVAGEGDEDPRFFSSCAEPIMIALS